MTRISVVIPCRDGAAFLGEALASVRAQTRPADQVIVVDDQSTDESARIAREMGATVLRTVAPGGTAVARNLGWRSADGDLIAFLDADDRWRPRHLELVAPLLAPPTECVLAFGSIEFFGMLQGRYPDHVRADLTPVDAAAFSAIMCPVPQMTTIIPRRELEAIGGYDESLKAVEDFDLFARLARRGPFVGAPEVTGDYRQHTLQTTRFRQQQVILECLAVRARSVDALRDTLPEAEVRAMDARLRLFWDAALYDCWRDGNARIFDATLDAHALVPRSTLLKLKWRLRRIVFWPPWSILLRIGRRWKRSRFWTRALDSTTRRAPRESS